MSKKHYRSAVKRFDDDLKESKRGKWVQFKSYQNLRSAMKTKLKSRLFSAISDAKSNLEEANGLARIAKALLEDAEKNKATDRIEQLLKIKKWINNHKEFLEKKIKYHESALENK